MPRLPKNYLNSVFFLYRTREDAEQGAEEGGTGFIVSGESVSPRQSFLYFVTNWHVAVKKGFPVVRLETHSGSPEIFDFDCADWHFSPDYDIAVVPVELAPDKHNVVAVPLHSFMTENYKEQHDIGPGDDVFMVGRFIDQQGLHCNVPAVRFGNISMDPAPLAQENGKKAESYCIDIHSRSGYSGSPVFVYRTAGYDLEKHLNSNDTVSALREETTLLAFLGIHWGQFPELWEISEHGKLNYQTNESAQPLMTGSRFITGLSGMTCVLPAWNILEVLEMPKLKEMRDLENARLRKLLGDIPIAEVQTTEETSSDNGDYLLRKMLNTPPKPRQ